MAQKCNRLAGFSVSDKILILKQDYCHNPWACIPFLAAYIDPKGVSYNFKYLSNYSIKLELMHCKPNLAVLTLVFCSLIRNEI